MSTPSAPLAAPAYADESYVIGIDYSTLYGRDEVLHRLNALKAAAGAVAISADSASASVDTASVDTASANTISATVSGSVPA